MASDLSKKRTIYDLKECGTERIEKHLRIALRDALIDDSFLDLFKIPRTMDLASVGMFDEDYLKSIVDYPIYYLDLNNYPEQLSPATTRFGRRIKDWVTLIALREGTITLDQISPGLNFYNNNRSFRLDTIYSDKNVFVFGRSEKHGVISPPSNYNFHFKVSFDNVDNSDVYEYLFYQLIGK